MQPQYWLPAIVSVQKTNSCKETPPLAETTSVKIFVQPVASSYDNILPAKDKINKKNISLFM
jgi:hypothetical protein